jgi:pyridoxamine 5'-phosphate oxidase family protein
MSAFTPDEIEYLRSQRHCHLATIGGDGRPHVVPVSFWLNEDEDSIDVGGVDFGSSKKWRDAQANPKVTVLVDDVSSSPRRLRAIEVRGDAEAHQTGGETINPNLPNFDPQFIRIRPKRIISWGMIGGIAGARDFAPNARDVP